MFEYSFLAIKKMDSTDYPHDLSLQFDLPDIKYKDNDCNSISNHQSLNRAVVRVDTLLSFHTAVILAQLSFSVKYFFQNIFFLPNFLLFFVVLCAIIYTLTLK